jgi:hypothetical protein
LREEGKMTAEQARVGRRVRTLMDFSGVPQGTQGVIDEDYGTGVMVAWDLATRPLPAGYTAHTGRPPAVTGILRDGFDKKKELAYLEVV